MQQLRHCRRNISNMYLTAGAAVSDLPTVEQQGDMRIVGIPLAVGRTYGRRILTELIPAWLQDQQDITRTTRMVTHQSPVTQEIRQTRSLDLLEIYSKHDMRSRPAEGHQSLLHLFIVQSFLGDILSIEVNAIGIDGGYHLQIGCLAQFFLQIRFALGSYFLPDFPGTTIQSVILHPLEIMRSTMVGRQEHEIIAFSHLIVESLQQSGDVLIQLQISLVCMFTAGGPLMTDDIRLRIADAEHICGLALAQTFSLQGCDGHIGGDMSAEGIEAHATTHFLHLLVLLQRLVNVLGPQGQFLHVVGTGNKLSVLSVEPVSSVGTTPCGQDGSTVLIGYTDDLRLEIRMHPDLVADGRRQQVAW